MRMLQNSLCSVLVEGQAGQQCHGQGSGHMALAWQQKLAWPEKNRNVYILPQIKENSKDKRENMELVLTTMQRKGSGGGIAKPMRCRVMETLRSDILCAVGGWRTHSRARGATRRWSASHLGPQTCRFYLWVSFKASFSPAPPPTTHRRIACPEVSISCSFSPVCSPQQPLSSF